MNERYGDSTRTVKAADSDALAGRPVSHIPVPASAFHLSADEGSEAHVYGRYSNPVWTHLESALAQLENATAALTFGSGMAAVTAALRVLTKPGAVLAVPADGYYQVRRYAAESLAPRGITVHEATAEEMCDAAQTADVHLVVGRGEREQPRLSQQLQLQVQGVASGCVRTPSSSGRS